MLHLNLKDSGSKLFYSSFKNKQVRNNITHLRDSQGNLNDDQKLISGTFVNYFKNILAPSIADESSEEYGQILLFPTALWRIRKKTYVERPQYQK